MIIIGSILAIIVIVFAIILKQAPMGYEDEETGFHYKEKEKE